MRRTALVLALLSICIVSWVSAGGETQLKGKVTMILGDKTPEGVSGAQVIQSGHAALDYNRRSLVIALSGETTVTRIVLKADPKKNRGQPTSNANMSADRLAVYASDDGKSFQRLRYRYEAPDPLTVVIAGITVDGLHPATGRYYKVHYNQDTPAYLFVNAVQEMAVVYGTPPAGAAAETATDADRLAPYRLADPLFAELLSDRPGPGFAMYWQNILGQGRATPYHPPWYRAMAKKFGQRYVLAEELDEAVRYRLSPWVLPAPDYKQHGIRFWRANVGDWGGAYAPAEDGMPQVFGRQSWVMDPRWQERYVRSSVEKATGDHWGLMGGDELWAAYAIKIPPKDKWYDKVIEADKEIREKYGFGKYGMPEDESDSDPFKRIAHRRWVNDKLTEMFRRTYEAVKAENPEMALISPDYVSAAPAGDHEAWAPYFDLIMSQTGQANNPYAHKFRVGCETKILADLTEKPVWMLVQQSFPVDWGFQATPEDIVERYSQVFRNGGEGLVLVTLEWYEPELKHPKYSEPEKWRALLHVVEQSNKMNRVKLPERADCAILYPSDTLLTHRFGQINEEGRQEIYSAYSVLGPFLRSWFKFVSDRQIERGMRDLGDYKVLYIPYGEYVRSGVLDRIEAYVKQGGTVVVTDTEAFTWNINGEEAAERWAQFAGVKKTGKRTGGTRIRTVEQAAIPFGKQIEITMPDPGFEVAAMSKGVSNLAVFDDGAPAVTLHKYGAGRVIVFASDPFGPRGKTPLVHPESALNGLFAAIQKAAGCAMGYDVWRFKFPPVPAAPEERQVCLTGNNVAARDSVLKYNLDTGGVYTYSRLPDGIPDGEEAGAPVPFGEGHLTNRVAAYKGRSTKVYPQGAKDDYVRQWIVSWTDPAPVSIGFDVKKEYRLERVRLVYSASMPALKVLGSNDGKTWSALAAAQADDAGVEVKDLTLGLKGGYRHVRLDFGKREAGEKFDLCEVELWGVPQP